MLQCSKLSIRRFPQFCPPPHLLHHPPRIRDSAHCHCHPHATLQSKRTPSVQPAAILQVAQWACQGCSSERCSDRTSSYTVTGHSRPSEQQIEYGERSLGPLWCRDLDAPQRADRADWHPARRLLRRETEGPLPVTQHTMLGRPGNIWRSHLADMDLWTCSSAISIHVSDQAGFEERLCRINLSDAMASLEGRGKIRGVSVFTTAAYASKASPSNPLRGSIEYLST
ncbi:hypothetical protein CSAL01_08876 [Colletotrichum salicis]|uniref:Uncharacterized protein n=1 Tax=Colletotrichum salicis TaxID=1209931 RepID=A0A135ULH7_9PEZI|nr:hypothetical protein CSAL01_08876 [Colletotrichum salicis]